MVDTPRRTGSTRDQRVAGYGTYFLTVDDGHGPRIVESIDCLTNDEIDTLCEVLTAELDDLGYAATVTAAAASDLSLANRIKAERDLENFRNEVDEGFVGITAAEMHVYSECDGITEKILQHRVAGSESVGSPRWDKEKSELSYGARKKRVRPTAKNVILVLDSFEKHGWPNRIDDPLLRGNSTRAEREGAAAKIRTTVQSLKKAIPFLEFSADGQGTGYRWKGKSV